MCKQHLSEGMIQIDHNLYPFCLPFVQQVANENMHRHNGSSPYSPESSSCSSNSPAEPARFALNYSNSNSPPESIKPSAIVIVLTCVNNLCFFLLRNVFCACITKRRSANGCSPIEDTQSATRKVSFPLCIWNDGNPRMSYGREQRQE